MADRLDVDDPLWSYTIRTVPTSPHSRLDSGMLQGFITATTFTNWQSHFMFSSLCPHAYEGDALPSAGLLDSDGSLSAGLQSCVRLGDPNNEGIIHPRVLEISLLGGLGCGAKLLRFVLDKAERGRQYDYAILQVRGWGTPGRKTSDDLCCELSEAP